MAEELSLCELMEKVGDLFNYNELCRLSTEQLEHYRGLLTEFQRVNSSISSTEEKGVALEELVAYLLNISGGIFSVRKNVKTSSNEIDEIIELNTKGRALLAYGLLPSRLSLFLGECKNHNKSVGVTYIGKFYSLLETTQIKTGILFSYHGISGDNWSDGSGLVKKIYLQRERDTDRVAIIEFSIADFNMILSGHNFFEIIEAKFNQLRFDTSIDSFISEHPAEQLIQID
ncbi:MAG: hypothetical protein SOZ49_02585 [Clostridiaceae bacterium]|nr:hypothetical protein [Clostridiaceae bacterium]